MLKMVLEKLKPAILMIPILACPALAELDSTGNEIRRPRSWAISAEVGLNSLASLLGPVVTYYVKPSIPMDVGVGFSSGGLRPGIRARYLFTPLEPVSFFGGIGYKYGMGTDGEAVKVKDPDTQKNLEITIDPASFLDGMVGVEYLGDHGFLVIANLGYSQLIGGRYYSVKSGDLSDKGKKAFDFAFASGIMLSVALGKAF